MPNVIASQLTGVQPMYVPSGKIFSMYSDYGESEFNKKYRFSRAKWYYCHFSLNDGESVLKMVYSIFWQKAEECRCMDKMVVLRSKPNQIPRRGRCYNV